MLSPWQNKVYRPLVDEAWRAHCGRSQGGMPGRSVSADAGDVTDQVARKHWYRKELLENFGAVTTKDIGPKSGPVPAATFDALCLHFSVIACDEEQIAYWSSGEERRALWRLEGNMKQAGLDWSYVRGIAKAMHLLDKHHSEIKDLPAEHILKLATALFLYVRRKHSKARREQFSEVPF